MKGLIDSELKFNIRGMLIEPSSNVMIQAFRAFFVGGVAFIGDAGVLWLLSLTGLYYLICGMFGFFVGVAINFVLCTKFVFKEKASMNKCGEIAVYVIVSLVGLGLTTFLLWLFTEIVGFYFMLSKCFATLLVFAWNFSARKYFLYRNGV